MNKAILLGTMGVAVALAMLGFGFVTGSPQTAKADAAREKAAASTASGLTATVSTPPA